MNLVNFAILLAHVAARSIELQVDYIDLYDVQLPDGVTAQQCAEAYTRQVLAHEYITEESDWLRAIDSNHTMLRVAALEISPEVA